MMATTPMPVMVVVMMPAAVTMMVPG